MASTRGVQHRGPAQNRVLDADVILLRKVNFKKLGPAITEMLRTTNLRAGEPEGDFPWFPEGYVAAEQPRNVNVSKALLGATDGFAIARTDSGDVLAEFETNELPKASQIAQRAKAELAVSILMAEAEAEEEEAAEEMVSEGGPA